MKKFNFSIDELKKRIEQNKDKPQPRNNLEDIKEQIWERIIQSNPKANRKMFFVKTGGIPSHELISFKKWAETTDNFCRAFYGALKKYHLNNHDKRKEKRNSTKN